MTQFAPFVEMNEKLRLISRQRATMHSWFGKELFVSKPPASRLLLFPLVDVSRLKDW